MASDFDAIRAANPTLQISIYGMTPGGDVVLEVIDPEGFTASWTGPTAEAVLAAAFPPEPAVPDTTPATAPAPASIFD